MIVTLTLNPAIDKTARIDALCPRGLNRLGQVERDVGGKGVNVSKMLAALGQDSIACGFAAGQAGRTVVETLRAWPGGHITPDFVALPGETRTNLKLVEPDGALTELNEPGPAAGPEHIRALSRTLLDHAGPDVLFVLAGSAGPGVPPDIYRDLTRALHAAGAKVLADADGPLFARAVQAAPDVVKPNAFELCQYFGVETTDDAAQLADMGRALTRQGGGPGLHLDGRAGRLLCAGRGRLVRPGAAGDAGLHRGGGRRHAGRRGLRDGPQPAAGGLPAPGHGGRRGGLHHPRHPSPGPGNGAGAAAPGAAAAAVSPPPCPARPWATALHGHKNGVQLRHTNTVPLFSGPALRRLPGSACRCP